MERVIKGRRAMVFSIVFFLICITQGQKNSDINGDHNIVKDFGHIDRNHRVESGYIRHGRGQCSEDEYNTRGLKATFYQQLCPAIVDVEETVWSVVMKHMLIDSSLAASLLRMQFHDCFVRGCDASVLLLKSSNASDQTERDNVGNQSLRGFEVIDDAKEILEALCPGVVSCADILALAARDAVTILGGPSWEVLTGRRDGLISLESEVVANIPAPFADFSHLKTLFQSKGFSVRDLVILSGAHTIGLAHCGGFSNRLNFSGKGDIDPTLDKDYADKLKAVCKPEDTTTKVPMDPGSEKIFDTHYFDTLKRNKGLFTSDAALLTDDEASAIVDREASGFRFFQDFAESMKRMVELDVLTGCDGEIRNRCAFVNSNDENE